MKTEPTVTDGAFFTEVCAILAQARQTAYRAVNGAMVEAYWQIEKRIIEEEQNGKDRADYMKLWSAASTLADFIKDPYVLEFLSMYRFTDFPMYCFTNLLYNTSCAASLGAPYLHHD